MRIDIGQFFLSLCCFMMPWSIGAQELKADVARILHVQSRSAVPDLTCQKALPKKPVGRLIHPQEPMVIPDAEMLDAEQDEYQKFTKNSNTKSPPPLDRNLGWLRAQPTDRPFRMAIWGDSHIAAGFFSAELIRLLGLDSGQVQSAFIPASMNRAGVRLFVRKTCVTSGWRYESAHAHVEGARSPGPALVNLHTTTPDESIAWDLRDSSGHAQRKRMTLLFQQAPNPITISLSVDEGIEHKILLNGPIGPGRLEIVGDAPLSVVKVRLLEGDLRVHGVKLEVPSSTKLQFESFGYPGATVSAWKSANISYLKNWLSEVDLQLVILAYGTNEGNQKPVDPIEYRDLLEKAVINLRSTFPTAACLLIAPGDRGILIPRSRAERFKHKATKKGKTSYVAPKNVASPPSRTKRTPSDLLLYSHIHQQIGDIQKELATKEGCQVWSMQEAMGGKTSAYDWARSKPALMAPDLIHFTINGYEELARKMARDIHWSPELLWADR